MYDPKYQERFRHTLRRVPCTGMIPNIKRDSDTPYDVYHVQVYCLRTLKMLRHDDGAIYNDRLKLNNQPWIHLYVASEHSRCYGIMVQHLTIELKTNKQP